MRAHARSSGTAKAGLQKQNKTKENKKTDSRGRLSLRDDAFTYLKNLNIFGRFHFSLYLCTHIALKRAEALRTIKAGRTEACIYSHFNNNYLKLLTT